LGGRNPLLGDPREKLVARILRLCGGTHVII
jgi:hypothetical protein